MYKFLFLILVAFWLLGGMVCLWLATMAGFKGKKRPWRIAAIYFFGPLVILIVLLLLGLAGAQVKPSRAEIVGNYRIDRGFCPGGQADWQHQTYSMTISEEWVEVRDVRTQKVWREEIEWLAWSEYRWRFKSDPEHHMVEGGPSIIRGKLGFYYVFESPLYGVVVFRKEGVTTKLKLLLACGFVVVMALCFWLAKSLEKRAIRSKGAPG